MLNQVSSKMGEHHDVNNEVRTCHEDLQGSSG